MLPFPILTVTGSPEVFLWLRSEDAKCLTALFLGEACFVT